MIFIKRYSPVVVESSNRCTMSTDDVSSMLPMMMMAGNQQQQQNPMMMLAMMSMLKKDKKNKSEDGLTKGAADVDKKEDKDAEAIALQDILALWAHCTLPAAICQHPAQKIFFCFGLDK